MKIYFKSILYIFVSFTVLISYVSESYAQNVWTSDTGYVLPRKTLETGVFQNTAYGITDTLEVGTHPLLFFIYPQGYVKKQWFKSNNLAFSSRHGMGIPTLLLNLLAREGTGGIYPADMKAPFVLSHFHEASVTYKFNKKFIVSGTGDLNHALTSGGSRFATVDMPLVYSRTAHWYEDNWYARVGIDIQGSINEWITYLIDIDYFFLPSYPSYINIEHKGALRFLFKKGRYGIVAGYKMVFGTYPFGKQFHIIPFADFTFRFNL
ncbi:hypothetical protein KKF34_08455 [Myxococcota bacterium]|nr:hypothetical protein [Myxococcota bacterium]MBU1379683.1 hypothetical protein [Myxococcota bacterium]MBU1496894.1 hypothetical protein [Myxococcota bacterium]